MSQETPVRESDEQVATVDDVNPEEVGAAVGYDEERLADMRAVLESRTLRILQQLLASETGALSPKEVTFRNPDVTESTIRDHLRTLTEEGLTEKLEPDVDSVPNTIPRTYYAVSEYGIDLLKQVGMYDGVAILYQVYEEMDRPEDIRAIEDWEHRPVPSWL